MSSQASAPMPGPRVSIVIPVYNGADFLESAIDSALSQSYRNIEIVVVNDGSNDDGATERIALSYGDRIRYYFKPNGHVASALNFGIRHMSGEYFSWLSHDDMYKPGKIDHQLEALSRLPADTVAYGDYEILHVESGLITPVHMVPVAPKLFRYHLTLDNSLHGCTLLIPKRCIDAVGPFNELLRTTQDYDMWFRLARRFPFVHVDGIVVTSRHHPQQGSHALRDLAQLECDRLMIQFVQELTVGELEMATEGSSLRAYLIVSSNLEQRGFPRAAETALSLARSLLDGNSFAQRLKFLVYWLHVFWLKRCASWIQQKLRAVTRRVEYISQ